MNKHDEIFKCYVIEMRESMELALDWWKNLMVEESQRGGSAEAASLRVRKRWPFGPSGHPYVIATYRKYCLACEQLNYELKKKTDSETQSPSTTNASEDGWGVNESQVSDDDDTPVSGWVLLIDRLRGTDNELALFLSGLVFKPMGFDKANDRIV